MIRLENLFRLGLANLKYYLFSTVVISILITIMSSMFIVSNICIDSLKDGVKGVSNKLGADIIIVPDEYNEEMKNALFTGQPNTITFNKKIINDIYSVEGVDVITTQLFISSLNSECCEKEIQFVIFDEDTDFIVKSWLPDYKEKLTDRDIIIGNDINYDVGQKVKFYNRTFNVAGKMKKTGMGYDQSIFVNADTGKLINTLLELDNMSDTISMVLLDVNKDADMDQVKAQLDEILSNKGMVAYKANELYSEVVKGIENIAESIYVFLVIIVVISTLSIFAIVTITVNQRRKEFSTMDIIGINDISKSFIIWFETLVVSLSNAVLGSLIGIGGIVLFRNLIEATFKMPFQIPTIDILLRYIVHMVLIAVVIGSVASIYSAYKVYSMKYYKLKEGI